MKRFATTLILSALSLHLAAATYSGFGIDAFNRSVSAATRDTAVFSPFSFEIDCVLFSEAFGALQRAKIAETMGVLNGMESVYRPLHEDLTKSEGRKLSMLYARAFCLPDERKAHPAYRQWLQNTFSAEAFTVDFRKGAECWFHSRLDGQMENFELPDKAASEREFSFYDLVSFRCSWKEPFPTNNTREIKFELADGSSCTIRAMCDLRKADVWTQKDMTILRLPMAESAWFYAILPNPGKTVRDIRGCLSSSTIVNIVTGMNSITEVGVSHGTAAIVIPKIDTVFESDLKLPLGYFRFPLTDMERLGTNIRPRFMRQRIRFRLDEQGMDDCAIGEKPSDQIVRVTKDTSRIVLNRPFLFFILHEPTSTIPIVGQFAGSNTDRTER